MTATTRRIVSFLLLSHQALALQVTPNSPCSSLCVDGPNQDVSDPNNSNTEGRDIVCQDSAYANTEVGQKFNACISCLQNSTSASSGEDDQGWFLYHLRYTLSSCLFGFSNATDIVTTPCSTSEACGHLKPALESGNLDPNSHGNTYSYCSASDNAFVGSFQSKCTSCLRSSADEKYLSNYMVALEAGCSQKPPVGMRIGLDGPVLSTVPVNITYPGDTGAPEHKKGLSQGGIIGVSVSAGVFLLMTVAALLVCFRKRINMRRMKKLHSPLDGRYGAKNITSPNDGSYGNPYASPAISPPFDASTLSVKERQVLGLQQPVGSRRISEPSYLLDKSWESPRQTPSNVSLPPYSSPGMPTHQAYIPTPVPTTVPESPVTSIASSSATFQNSMSAYSTPNTSPKHFLPPSPEAAKDQRSPALHSIRSVRTQLSPPISQSQFNTPRNSPQPPPIKTQLPPRSNSRADSTRNLITKLAGSSSTAASSNSAPVEISAPLVNHSRRFDLGEAQSKQREQEQQAISSRGRRKADMTPESAESDEQWPGSY